MNLDTESHVVVGPEKLIRMAQEIANFFKMYPEARAIDGIATHINKFWTPNMREAFLAASAEPEYRLPPLLMAAREKIKRKKAL